MGIGNALSSFLSTVSTDYQDGYQNGLKNALSNKTDPIDAVNKFNDQDIEMAKFGGKLATALKAAPLDQRASIYAQYAPILKRHQGFDAEDEALFQTDQGLDQIINTAKFLTPAEKPIQVAAGAALVDPTTRKEVYRAPDKANNWANENSLREMQIRAQMDSNRATRESTDAYRQAAQSMQQQKMMQDQYNSDRNFDLSKSRIDQQISQQQAAEQKIARLAQGKLAPLREAVANSEEASKKFGDLINSKDFSGAVGWLDNFTAPVGAALLQSEEGQTNRKAQMLISDFIGKKVKELGGNPSNTDLVFTLKRAPKPSDGPQVWKSWYEDELLPATQRAKARLEQEAALNEVPAYPGQQAPQAPQRPGQLQQFRSSTGITFEVQ